MNILVTGARGQLGRAFVRQLGKRAVPLDSQALDVTDANQVRRVVSSFGPDAIVNCAAYTRVDQAESDAARCAAVNADAVRYLAEAAQRRGAVLIQISTDYVFGAHDSHRNTPYLETDRPGPQSIYGQTKLEGERNAPRCQKHFIVRTCGLYGSSPTRNNFVENMLQLAGGRKPIRVVDDQQCTPTFVDHVARAVQFLLSRSSYGIYHIVNSGSTTWYAFATEIFRLANIDVPIQPTTSAELAAAATRPSYSVLDTTKYHALGGPPMPHWTHALAEYIAQHHATAIDC